MISETSKCRLTNETRVVDGMKLYRIQAVWGFGDVKKGDLGGFVDSADRIATRGECWVYDDAAVYATDGEVCSMSNNAKVKGHSTVVNSVLKGDALIDGDVHFVESVGEGNIRVEGRANVLSSELKDDAQVTGDAEIERTRMSGNSVVGDHSKVVGSSLRDNARAKAFSQVFHSTLKDNTEVSGRAIVTSSILTDNVKVSGSSVVQADSELSGDLAVYNGEVTSEQNQSSQPSEPKYRLTSNTKYFKGVYLQQIKAVRDFGDIQKGTLGGFVRSTDNLSQEGLCWIDETSIVSEDARITGDAQITRYSKVHGHAEVSGEATVDNSEVSEFATVRGKAFACDSNLSGASWLGREAVAEKATLKDYASVTDCGQVFGSLSGRARVEGAAQFSGSATDNVVIAGDSVVGSSVELSGDAVVVDSVVDGTSRINGTSQVIKSSVNGDVVIMDATVSQSTIEGSAMICEGAEVTASLVEDKAYIAEGAIVQNSTINGDTAVVNLTIVDGITNVTETDINFDFVNFDSLSL